MKCQLCGKKNDKKADRIYHTDTTLFLSKKCIKTEKVFKTCKQCHYEWDGEVIVLEENLCEICGLLNEYCQCTEKELWDFRFKNWSDEITGAFIQTKSGNREESTYEPLCNYLKGMLVNHPNFLIEQKYDLVIKMFGDISFDKPEIDYSTSEADIVIVPYQERLDITTEGPNSKLLVKKGGKKLSKERTYTYPAVIIQIALHFDTDKLRGENEKASQWRLFFPRALRVLIIGESKRKDIRKIRDLYDFSVVLSGFNTPLETSENLKILRKEILHHIEMKWIDLGKKKV